MENSLYLYFFGPLLLLKSALYDVIRGLIPHWYVSQVCDITHSQKFVPPCVMVLLVT